jgi:hypothetical protein
MPNNDEIVPPPGLVEHPGATSGAGTSGADEDGVRLPRVAGSRWASPDWWMNLGVLASLLVGLGTGVFIARVVLLPHPVWSDVGGFLFLTAFYGIWCSGAAAVLLVGPIALWKAIADERDSTRWRVRAEARRRARAEQEGRRPG